MMNNTIQTKTKERRNDKMKKILSSILALSMILMTAIPAYAEEGQIKITGEVLATVIDSEVPTDTSYIVNPNAIEGEQFIAPDFIVKNNTNAPISVSVNLFKTAEDSPHKFTDVAPTHFTDTEWAKLGVEDSEKYLALALVIKDADEWRDLFQTDPLYVSDVEASEEAIELGSIDPNTEVTFTLSAKHGLAFNSAKESEHHLGFLFSLL